MLPRKRNQKPTALSITEFAFFRIFWQEQNVQMTHLACDSQLELNYTKRDLDPPTPTPLIIDRSHPYLRREDLKKFPRVFQGSLTSIDSNRYDFSCLTRLFFLNLPAPPKHCGVFDSFYD